MSIEKQSYLYEVLIRGAADGSIAGAHQIHAERVIDTDTGAVLAEKAGDAQPLDPADIGKALDAAFARSVADLITERSLRKAAEQARDDALSELAAARAAARPDDASSSGQPGVVRNMQLRRAINAAGLRDAIESYLATASYDDRDSWEWQEFISVDAPEIVAACAAIGISDAQRVALFKAAAAL